MISNIKSVFTDIFKDPLWKLKFPMGIIIFTLFSLVSVIANPKIEPVPDNLFAYAVGFFLACFLYFFLRGYFYKFLFNIYNDSNEFLPCWRDSGIILKIGLKYALGIFLLTIPTTLIGIVLFLSAYYIPSLESFAVIGGAALAFFLIVFYLPFVLLMSLVYSQDLKMSSFFDFTRAKELLKKGKTKFYLIYLLLLFYLVFGTLVTIKFNYQIWSVICVSVISYYLILTWFYLLGLWASPQYKDN